MLCTLSSELNVWWEYTHFIDEETEAVEVKWLNKQWDQESDLGT